MSLDPKPLVLRLPFQKGWEIYTQLVLLIGEHRAQLALTQCLDICCKHRFIMMEKAMKIADSAYINPAGIAGVDIVVALLADEVLKTMISTNSMQNDSRLEWELFSITPSKLNVMPRFGHAINHPLLGGNYAT